MGYKIKAIRERLDAIAKDSQNLQLGVRLEDKGFRSKLREETDSFAPTIVVGREDDKAAILKLLLTSNDEENVSVISIVGIGGLGKTTLAQLIFNNELVQTHFDLRLWVCVSNPFDVKVIVKKILESGTGEKPDNLELNTLKDSLGKIINGKKYLLVLDDIWSEDHEKWDRLKKFLSIGASGSKIIVTTRSTKVAELVSTSQPYVLNGLSNLESWSLLVKIVFKGKEPKNPSVVEIGKEIVEKCVGVPLAIKTIGSVLCFKNPETEWLPFMKNELSKIVQNETDILPTLKLSYDHLPSNLKHCFAYCRLFPKDYRICVETLIHLWIAQGFVESSNSSQSLEDIGLEYFMDLLWRSFFQEIERDAFGRIQTCKMHDLMHDLATLVAGNESIMVDSNVKSIDEKTRNVSIDLGSRSIGEVPACFLGAKQLRTFLLRSQERLEKSNHKVIISKFRRLRVCDLHNAGIEEVPYSIKKLKNLRYLDVSGNKGIVTLPYSITELRNLQVLKLSNCMYLKELPKNMWKLVNLRHLYCKGCVHLTHMPIGLGELTSLQTLSMFVVAKDSLASNHNGGLDELKRLNNLRGQLEISNLRYVENGISKFDAANLKAKQNLRSLTLDWGTDNSNDNNENGNYDEMSLQSLEPHLNLREIKLRCYGGLRFPNWLSSLTNLVNISIEESRRCQYLPPFYKFPFLKRLRIFDLANLEYVEKTEGENFIVGSSTFFPSLKELHLLGCPNLKGWWKNGNHDNDLAYFPCLSSLSIYSCPKLTWMPPFPFLDEELDLNIVSAEILEQTLKMKVPMTSSSTSSSLVHPLSKLKKLMIMDVEDLESLPEEWLQNLTSLEELSICGVPILAHLGLSCLVSLKELILRECLSLTSLQGMHFLTSLQYLQLWTCPSLTTIPQEMYQLSSLQTLIIGDCPHLSAKCGNQHRDDWPKIVHIPNIRIDFLAIQLEGCYVLDDLLAIQLEGYTVLDDK
ncbi:putative disease resistance protein RGA4 [Jatropha curcas]|nr:putative disease resistance protein RGA4 [Jatropha curcas]